MALDQEIAGSEDGRIHRAMARFRGFMARHFIFLMIYRIVVITLGFVLLLAGVIMLVTPGPGWLFIFLGMSIWGTEFTWAHRLNVWAKAKVLSFWRSGVARVEKRRHARQEKKWAGREKSCHYCPTREHYH